MDNLKLNSDSYKEYIEPIYTIFQVSPNELTADDKNKLYLNEEKIEIVSGDNIYTISSTPWKKSHYIIGGFKYKTHLSDDYNIGANWNVYFYIDGVLKTNGLTNIDGDFQIDLNENFTINPNETYKLKFEKFENPYVSSYECDIIQNWAIDRNYDDWIINNVCNIGVIQGEVSFKITE